MNFKCTTRQIFFLLMFLVLEATAQEGCDRVFSSYQSGNKTGKFQSPGYPSHYPNGVNCKYKFIGRKGKERVKIKFTNFNLQGRRPSCTNDYVNIYSQLKTESENLLGAQLTGPFCGEGTEGLPALLLSTRHILVIFFYSNSEKSNYGFKGTYEFVDEIDHDMSTVSPDYCAYTLKSSAHAKGNIFSPTYPGVYPDNIFCSYSLQGRPGERIKLTFQDFSLFYGGEYCPFDYLIIYDGNTKYDPQIGKFCGSYNKSTVIYSTTGSLRLEFTTGQDRRDYDEGNEQNDADFQFERRGFNISYEFSDRFVKLDHLFVRSGAQHIRGTECDLRIMSGKESNGTFVSPNHPGNFPKGIVCRYYLDGLMDEQNLEKVKVKFYDFHISGNMPYCELGYLGESKDSRSGDGAVKAKYCGKIKPPVITSNGPRMVIKLNSSDVQGKFVAEYRFITDYGIRGQQIEEGQCKYHYPSTETHSKGIVNSPRHSHNYPPNSDCEYIFRPRRNEMVLISFTVFVLSDKWSLPCTSGDYVALYEDVGRMNKENYTLSEKYCGQIFPGPYSTSRMLKMIFHSDHKDGYVGFEATYKFFKTQALVKSKVCDVNIDARGTGGVITSPKYPANYPALMYCSWQVTASRPENRILVEVSDINMEGDYGRSGSKSSCPNVALRLYNDSMRLMPVDLICGKRKETDVTNTYMSLHDSFHITFVTSNSSHGGTGFKISWTEIHTGASTMDCTGFQCARNKYCIAPSLKCNSEPNCGQGDNSDETAECPNSSGVQILHIAIGTSISSFFCIILLICGFYHRRKFRTDRAPLDHDHVEVRYVSAPTGCNTTDRLLMEDRNDGNNMGNENHNNTSSTQSPRCQKVSMV